MKLFERRVRHLGIAFAVLYAVILGRYFHLQVVLGGHYARESERRRQNVESIAYRRGGIYDREGKLLVADQRAFHLAFRPGYFERGGALGALSLLSTLVGPEALRGADERLWPESPADVALAVRARDLSARGERGVAALTALRRVVERLELPPEAMASFVGPEGPAFGEAIGPEKSLVLRYRSVEDYEIHKRLVLVAIAAARPSFETLRAASDGVVSGILAARRSDVADCPSESLRREAERAIATLFDMPSADVRSRLHRAERYDSLEAILSTGGGEPLRDRARRVIAEEASDLERVAAIVSLPVNDLLARIDAECLAADADKRAAMRFHKGKPISAPASDRETERRFRSASDDFPFRERVVARDVGSDPALRVACLPGAVAGLSIREASARRSLLPIAPHLLGFTAEPDESGQVGRSGIEKAFDEKLRGTPGREVVERDRRGREIAVIERQDPLPGQDLILTLDSTLQSAAEAALAGKKGGAIVVDVRTGDVLAAASAPLYALDTVRRDFGLLAADRENQPLLSRVTRRTRQPYPGSTFKVVVALAGLEMGLVTPATRYRCAGYMHRPGEFTCLGVHGDVDLDEALAKSCNVYFYHLGEKLGGRALDAWAKRFGFGASTGFETGDDPGRLRFDEASSWTAADSRFLAIGQVNIEATLAQVARMTVAVARGGEMPELRVVRSIGGRPDRRPPPARLGLDPANVAAVRNALRSVVTSGTAANSGLAEFDAAGKSGTAQTGRRDGLSPDHAWFTGYAPANAPEVAVTVLLEFEGRHGGDAAAPVAAEILRHVFAGGRGGER